MKFIHISDTHIFRKRFHNEYRVIFDELYKQIDYENPDVIIHTGDIAHSKVQQSPEFFDLCYEFLYNLSIRKPTYIILGNHDLLRNADRMDAISPIVKAIKETGNNNIHLLLEPQEISLGNDFILNALTIFDEENWIRKPTNPEKINIALYHGSVSGCKTDTGFTITNGEATLDLFENFDYALLGDIHKTNQIMDKQGRVRYAGSTTQTNFGETDDKGILLWNIKNKEEFSVKHIHLPNPKPFFSLHIEDELLPSNVYIPSNARLRLVSKKPISTEKQNLLLAEARYKWNPYSAVFSAGDFLPRSFSQFQEDIEKFQNLNLRDVSVQHKLMKDYLSSFEITDKTFEKVLELNDYYNSQVSSNELVARNVRYFIETFEWDNLLNYGQGNKVSLYKFVDVVGLFGKNYTGKSSFIDALLFTLFNSISKNSRKSVNLIHHDEDWARGKVILRVEDERFIIERKLEKFTKKIKGAETEEAKTFVSFYKENIKTGMVTDLSGESRNETDAEIRRYFGTLEDFLLTSMSWQFGAFNFIEEGSTERNKILSRFMDIDFFHKKFELAKEDSKFLKKELSARENINVKEKLQELQKEKNNNELSQLSVKSKLKEIENKIIEKTTQKHSLSTSIEEIASIHEINIDDIKKKKNKLEDEIENGKTLLYGLSTTIASLKDEIEGYKKTIELIPIEKLEPKKKKVLEINDNLANNEKKAISLEKKRKQAKKQITILQEIPCGDVYLEKCRFIQEAGKSKTFLEKEFEKQKREIEKESKTLNEDKAELGGDNVLVQLSKRENLKVELEKQKNKLVEKELKKEKLSSSLKQKEQKFNELKQEEKFFYENQKAIENLSFLKKQKREIEKETSELNAQKETENNKLTLLYKEHGSIEERKKHLINEEKEFAEKRKKFEAFELFMSCYHPNGLSAQIIKGNLALLNQELSKILSLLCDFEAEFGFYKNKLFIYIIKNGNKYPIEIGSGAEKTLIAFAIRLALTKLTTLPKANFFILDEPSTSLDEDNMDGFVSMLEVLKTEFDYIILISHLLTLQECARKTLEIERKDDKSYLFVE